MTIASGDSVWGVRVRGAWSVLMAGVVLGLGGQAAIADDAVAPAAEQREVADAEDVGDVGDLQLRYAMARLKLAELDTLIAEDPSYARVVCRCEKISEAEIVRAIRTGHTTMEGIKFATRAGMGRCQGGFCSFRVMEILHRETGMEYDEITKRGGGSYMVQGKLDE